MIAKRTVIASRDAKNMALRNKRRVGHENPLGGAFATLVNSNSNQRPSIAMFKNPIAENALTLRVIASKLGCSRSTVSYALRNQAEVSEETRNKVQALARQLGWKPDAKLSRQLALVRNSGRSDRPNLAIILNKPPSELAEEHAPRMHLLGAKARAISLGYNIEEFNLSQQPLSPERLMGVLAARGIEGVVYLATTGSGAMLDPKYMRLGCNFACSVVGIRYPDPQYHVAMADQYSSGQIAVSNLLKLGFKRPGAVLPRGLDRILSWSFGCGVQAGTLDLPPGRSVPVCYVGTDENFLPDSGFPEIEDWIERERPDVLISTDMLNIYRFLDQRRSPRQRLRVCALEHFRGITRDFGVDPRDDAVGAAAVDLVVAQLHRGECGVPEIQRTLQIEGVWVPGGSVHMASGQARPVGASVQDCRVQEALLPLV